MYETQRRYTVYVHHTTEYPERRFIAYKLVVGGNVHTEHTQHTT
jgi:hypothetical protein